jgi:hypothetical protein
MVGEPETRLTICEFPRKDDFQSPPIPMILARRTAKSTVFVALLQAERGNLPPAKASVERDRFGLLRITVEERGTVQRFHVKSVR